MMKQIVIVFLIIISLDCLSQVGKENTTNANIEHFHEVDYSEFIGKEVGKFLELEELRGFQEVIFLDSKPGLLVGVHLIINEEIYLEILVDEYEHVKRFSIKRDWDFTLFSKEKISEIRIYGKRELLAVFKKH